VRPSELGDLLTISLTPTRIGGSSCTLALTVSVEAEERLRATVVLVCMDLARKKSQPWPDELRQRMIETSPPPDPRIA
jgi:4-hydroxybenzoyl-CoA thioesterase